MRDCIKHLYCFAKYDTIHLKSDISIKKSGSNMAEHDDPIVGEIKTAVSFPVDVECEGYSDVIFNVIFEKHGRAV